MSKKLTLVELRQKEEAVPLPDLRTPEDEHYPEPWGDDDEF